nr:TlpA family protein disulfide reductase [Pseudarcicella sp.]
TAYLEPGKTTFQYIDMSEYTSNYKSSEHRKKREKKTLFMGNVAKINADLLVMDTIRYYDYDKAQLAILEMNGNEYKNYCLDILEKEQNTVNQLLLNNKISKKALQIQKMDMQYNAFENILSFNRTKISAYRKKNNIPKEQKEIPIKEEEFLPEYYSFLKAKDLNNPISLVTTSAYYFVINRIRFHNSVWDNIKKLKTYKTDSVNQKEATKPIDSTFIKDPKTIKKTIIENLKERAQMEENAIKTIFGLDKGLAIEIMFVQSIFSYIKSTQKPFSENEIKDLKNKISNEFIANYLVVFNENKKSNIEENLVANKTKTGYFVNETPKNEGDKLFEAMMKKYKGKVVFVDFWATWCGPCRSGIEKIKPLKEELKNEAIQFVYITNDTSPIDTWNMMIPDIKGEHYKVSKDEWNYLASKFNIGGIPHYLLVDKNGNVVKNKMHPSSNEELKSIFNEYLKSN